MNNIPRLYTCRKCTRIVDNYPFGCREDDCPVKHDVINDWKFDINFGIPFIIIVMVLIYFGFNVLGGR